MLSGGERSRSLLAREFAKANLLVLDEPTNDLDLETLDLLQEVIGDYDGTVLIVSHDRDFLDRTVTVTLGLDGSGRVDVVAGGYEDWQAKRQKPVARKAKSSDKPDERDAALRRPPQKPTKLSYKDQRDLEHLPARIEELEAAIAKGETILSDPDLYTADPQRFATISQGIENARAEKDAAEERWLDLAEQVEASGLRSAQALKRDFRGCAHLRGAKSCWRASPDISVRAPDRPDYRGAYHWPLPKALGAPSPPAPIAPSISRFDDKRPTGCAIIGQAGTRVHTLHDPSASHWLGLRWAFL